MIASRREKSDFIFVIVRHFYEEDASLFSLLEMERAVLVQATHLPYNAAGCQFVKYLYQTAEIQEEFHRTTYIENLIFAAFAMLHVVLTTM